jgi:hypothetical protein
VVGSLSACQDARDVATADNSRAGVAAEGGRLVTEALTAALLDIAEALRAAPSDAAATPPDRDAPAGREAGRGGATRSLASLPSRAAADAAGAIAAAIVPAVVERIDVNALLARVDVDALVARIDVDRILDSIDPNRVLDRVDVDELVERVDMAAVAREALEGIDLGDMIQESTASIATDTLEAIRVQAMRADDLLARIVDRLLLRRRPRDTALARRAGAP